MPLLTRLESIKPFTENEAWLIFKTAALAEAVGWTLLIISIVINKYHLIGYKIAVPIAGRIHGTFFLIYFAILAVTYTSLNWSRRKFAIAILAGVPPYGTLAFEMYTSFFRQQDIATQRLLNFIYYDLTKGFKAR